MTAKPRAEQSVPTTSRGVWECVRPVGTTCMRCSCAWVGLILHATVTRFADEEWNMQTNLEDGFYMCARHETIRHSMLCCRVESVVNFDARWLVSTVALSEKQSTKPRPVSLSRGTETDFSCTGYMTRYMSNRSEPLEERWAIVTRDLALYVQLQRKVLFCSQIYTLSTHRSKNTPAITMPITLCNKKNQEVTEPWPLPQGSIPPAVQVMAMAVAPKTGSRKGS